VGTLDQSTSTSNGFYDMTSSNQWFSQTFTAGLSGVLSRVDVGLAKNGNPTSVQVSIRGVNGSGAPVAPDLASETVLASGMSSRANGQPATTVVFSSPVNVVANTQYAIYVSSCSGCSNGTATVSWRAAGNSYAGGDGTWYNNPNLSGISFWFATYVSNASIAPVVGSTPPDVLQHVGLPMSGNCADVDDSTLNWAGVSTGGWTPSWAQWMNDGSGGAICGRTLYYAPSGRWAVRS
jgi:hypothetical protein